MAVPLPHLAERIRERTPELERATLTRVCGIADPRAVGDPHYVSGLRRAVGTAVAYAISGIEGRPERTPPIPAELPAQARFAARSGVPLDTVLRRYFAGYTLLGDLVIRTIEESATELSTAQLQRLWRSEAALFDRLIAAVSAEYGAEAKGMLRSAEQRRAGLVRRLLDGELVDHGELRYELSDWHLGIVARGPQTGQALRALATRLGRSLLMVCPDGQTAWAWLGGRSRLEAPEALERAAEDWPEGVSASFGEAGRAVDGWRLSHRQARAAYAVLADGPDRLLRYGDVALLASAMGDEVLASSLRVAYLAPLAGYEHGGEAVLRETLRTYFAADRNVSSAAAALGVSRPTLKRRLHAAERCIGRSLEGCVAEMETALRLQELSE